MIRLLSPLDEHPAGRGLLRLPGSFVWCGLLIAAFATSAPAADPPAVRPGASRPVVGDELARKLGINPYLRESRPLALLKVAVLDSGFAGVDGARTYLPPGTVLVEHYDPEFIRRNNLGDPDYKKEFIPDNSHGRSMAQIVWATIGGSATGPQFLLLNANGPTMFRRAVRYAVEQKVDVILFSGHFEGAGNYDGQGPINASVTEAVNAGIIWINAVGNLRGFVYDGPLKLGADGWLVFDHNGTGLRFRNRVDENSVTVTLTWSDYRNEEDAGTSKDLDLFVEDPKGRVIGTGALKQVTGPAGEGETRNPRERVTVADLAAFEQPYMIRIKAKSGTFAANDRIRVLVSPTKASPRPGAKPGTFEPAFAFVDARRGREVFPPADHPGVISVGDPLSSSGPTSDGRTKPDVVLSESRVVFTNGDETTGSSNAAALFAGIAILMKAAEPGLTTSQLRQFADSGRRIALRSENRQVNAPKTLSPNWTTPSPRELSAAVRPKR